LRTDLANGRYAGRRWACTVASSHCRGMRCSSSDGSSSLSLPWPFAISFAKGAANTRTRQPGSNR
jgi:hypothetical protein